MSHLSCCWNGDVLVNKRRRPRVNARRCPRCRWPPCRHEARRGKICALCGLGALVPADADAGAVARAIFDVVGKPFATEVRDNHAT